MIAPLKFLGMETTDGKTLKSKTRRGTERALKEPISSEEFERKASESESISNSRRLHWRMRKEGLLIEPLKWASKHSVLNNLINQAVSPDKPEPKEIPRDLKRFISKIAAPPKGPEAKDLPGLVGTIVKKRELEQKPGLLKGIPKEWLYRDPEKITSKGRKPNIWNTLKVNLACISTHMVESLFNKLRKGCDVKSGLFAKPTTNRHPAQSHHQ